MRFASVSAVPLLLLIPGMAFAQPAPLPPPLPPALPPAALPPASPAPAAAAPAPAAAAPAPAAAAPAPMPMSPPTSPAVSANGAPVIAGPVPGAVTQDGMPTPPVDANAVPVDPTTDWALRDRDLGETANMEGSVGLLHMRHAQVGMPGQFRMQFMTQFFSGGWLCSPEYPCRDPAGGAALTTDSHDHVGGQIALGLSLTRWLDVNLATTAYASSNTANRPALIQVLGDTTLGAKAAGKLGRTLYLGGAFDLSLLNGLGSVGLSSVNARFSGLATLDLRGSEKKTPARFSFNASYVVDESGSLISAVEQRRGAPISRIERAGLRVNRTDHVDLRLGGEVFLASDKVRPFAEFGIDIPVNRQGYLCRANNPSSDGCLATDATPPSRLTLGVRVLPWKRGLSFTGAFDIGTTGTSGFIEETTPQLPWTLFLGAGWAVDTAERPPVEITKTFEKIIKVDKPLGKIAGLVREKLGADGKGGTAPVANAQIIWANHPDINPLLGGADGRFVTQDLPPGEYAFSVRAEGYKSGECSTNLVAESPLVQLECTLEALPRVGVAVVHARDEQGGGIEGATVKLTAAGKEYQLKTDSQGVARFVDLPPGTVSVFIDADTYLTAVGNGDVKTRQDSAVDVAMHKKPKNSLVNIGKTEITIKQQVQFELNSAKIMAQSDLLLEEIADALIKNPRLKRVEIQGHTDNTGTADGNMTLSDARANAVRAWLTAHGVTPDRLVAKGYGQTRPLVPNVTANNKSRNRRVQFVILDQEAAATTEPAVTPRPAKKADAKKPDAPGKLDLTGF